MYEYVRNLVRPYYLHLSSVFVSDHPTLMDRYGQYLVEFSPKPDSKFLLFPGVNTPDAFTAKMRDLVGSWIQSEHPELLTCYQYGTTDSVFTGNAIDYLALEASGAEWISHGTYSSTQFYFILNPFSIQKMIPSPLQ